MATCGIWVRGGGCELLQRHDGTHRNQQDLHLDLLRIEIESLRAENERLRAENERLRGTSERRGYPWD